MYLPSFLLHGFIKQREAADDEFLADNDCAPHQSGSGVYISVPHGLTY